MKRPTTVRRLLVASLVGAALIIPSMQVATNAQVHAASAPAPTIVGDWHNTAPNGNNLTHVIITPNPNGTFTMHSFGACVPQDCDQGLTTAIGSTSSAQATYHFSFAVKTESISIQGPYLLVGTHTHFIDGSGRADYDSLDFMYHYGSSGSWYNMAPTAGSITRIDLFTIGTQLQARLFRACTSISINCIWQTVPVSRSYPGYASFPLGPALVTVMLAGPGPTMQTDTIVHANTGQETHRYESFALGA